MPDVQPSYESSLTPDGFESPFFRCVLSHSNRDATWIRLCGELDLAAAPRLRHVLREAVGSARLIVVDLRQLTFMDSTGIQVIMDADTEATSRQRRMVFVRGPAQVHRLLKLIGIEHRLHIIDPMATHSLPGIDPFPSPSDAA